MIVISVFFKYFFLASLGPGHCSFAALCQLRMGSRVSCAPVKIPGRKLRPGLFPLGSATQRPFTSCFFLWSYVTFGLTLCEEVQFRQPSFSTHSLVIGHAFSATGALHAALAFSIPNCTPRNFSPLRPSFSSKLALSIERARTPPQIHSSPFKVLPCRPVFIRQIY